MDLRSQIESLHLSKLSQFWRSNSVQFILHSHFRAKKPWKPFVHYIAHTVIHLADAFIQSVSEKEGFINI